MNVLEIRGAVVDVGHGRHLLTAVDGADLELAAGGVLGLVGESGSGKSTLARAIAGMTPLRAGQILVDGSDYTGARRRRLRELRRRVQLVFQDPRAALNPRMTAGAAIAEVLTVNGRTTRGGRRADVARLLELVALDPRHADARPGELSGGQRQRVALARALAVEPDVIIADEVTSALDASVQGAVLNLLNRLRRETGLSLMVISHDLAVVRYLSDTIAVMHLGRIVEVAPTDRLVEAPRHPYTHELIEAATLAADVRQPGIVDTEPPDPLNPPSGCRYRTLCPIGPLVHPDRTVCVTADPRTGAERRVHGAACHFAPEGSASEAPA